MPAQRSLSRYQHHPSKQALKFVSLQSLSLSVAVHAIGNARMITVKRPTSHEQQPDAAGCMMYIVQQSPRSA